MRAWRSGELLACLATLALGPAVLLIFRRRKARAMRHERRHTDAQDLIIRRANDQVQKPDAAGRGPCPAPTLSADACVAVNLGTDGLGGRLMRLVGARLAAAARQPQPARPTQPVTVTVGAARRLRYCSLSLLPRVVLLFPVVVTVIGT